MANHRSLALGVFAGFITDATQACVVSFGGCICQEVFNFFANVEGSVQ